MMQRVKLEDPKGSRMRHCLRAVRHGQFGVDIAEMALDCAARNKQLFGNLSVRRSIRQQVQHFQFAVGERLQEWLLESGALCRGMKLGQGLMLNCGRIACGQQGLYIRMQTLICGMYLREQ